MEQAANTDSAANRDTSRSPRPSAGARNALSAIRSRFWCTRGLAAEPASRSSSSTHLGTGMHITGQIECTEDLQIDGKMEGPISLKGYTLTVGSTATLKSEITAGGIIVHGKVVGNLFATDRVDIRTDGSVIGDISTSRISIEDGAHFKGRIEIDPAKFLASKR